MKIWQHKKTGKNAELKVRKPNFKYGNIPNHWMQGNGLLTHVVNTLSVAFPGGERFFIRTVQRLADKASTAELREDIKKFIGQEVQHGKAHDQFNEILEELGYPNAEIGEALEKIVLDYIEPFVAERISKNIGISLTAAAEHYTASWAANFLRYRHRTEGVPDTLRELFLWHACEEVEHRHVAFDLMEEATDHSYTTRLAGMLMLTPMIVGGIALGTALFVRQDDEITWADIIKQLPSVLTDNDSLGRDLAKAFVQYLKPGFHPNDNDDLHLIDEFLGEKPQALAS